MADKYLIVGLGNPGREYEKTRHNVGFMVIDALAQKHGLTAEKKERKSITLDGTINGRPVLLVKPQTYMNLSGEAVRGLMDFYKIPVERVIIVHDDIDIPSGTLRIRGNGSAGGQNGVRNIIQHLGTQDFARVRFGVGRPPGSKQARDYVLQPFKGDEAILILEVIDKAMKAIEAWMKDGLESAMTAYNGDVTAKAAPQPAPDVEIEVALRAHELSPNDPKPLEQLARLYKKLRKLDEAIAAHMQLSELHERLGDVRPMLFELENASSIRPDNLELQERIAKLHEEQGNTKFAVSRWLKIAEYAQQDDKVDLARRAVEEALRMNPQHPKALKIKESLPEKAL